MTTTTVKVEYTPEQLEEMFEQYITLRDTVQALTAEKDDVAAVIRDALEQGHTLSNFLYTAHLKPSYSTRYAVADFCNAFGETATLTVCEISPQKVQDLVKMGEIDPVTAAGLAQKVLKSKALVLVKNTRTGASE